MRPLRSLRNQLLLWLVLPSIALWIAGGYGTYRITAGLIETTHDDALEDSARTMASRLTLQPDGQILLGLSPEALNVLHSDPNDVIYFQIRGPRGELVSGEEDIPPPPYSTEKLSFFDIDYKGQQVRACALRYTPDRAHPESSVTIQVAETVRSRTAIVTQTIKTIMPALALIISVAALSVWYGVKRGLASLDRVREIVSRRSYTELNPIDEASSPTEVQPLLKEINNLLKRLSEGRALHHRFIENAAHQLRTPIAGLKGQFQLAMRDPATQNISEMKDISAGFDRVSRLINQLLILARAEPQAAELSMELIDLEHLVKDAAREMVPQADKRSIDLGFEGAGRQVLVKGDPVSLHDLVINLLDNAVRYTPPGGTVTARIDAEKEAKLIIEDSGPGIRPEERERVFERFYRGPGKKAEGSGLGLSIVQEIAVRHGAAVTLENRNAGPGLVVRVSFSQV